MKYKIFTITLFIILAYTSLLNAQIQVQCGDFLETEFTNKYQTLRFVIDLAPGDILRIWGDAFGDYLKFGHVNIYAPSGSFVGGQNAVGTIGQEFEVITGTLGERGAYSIEIQNNVDTGIFTLEIGCTLRDGDVIEPGQILEEGPEGADNNASKPPQVSFSGFGFPGLAPIDFSSGIEIPLAPDQSQTVPVGGDVVLYTYQASANEIRSLGVSRVSGDISIGVAVINKDTNEIIFFGGLPSSNNLHVELAFPSTGTYAIGLFRIDTTERTGTSGAVQINLE